MSVLEAGFHRSPLQQPAQVFSPSLLAASGKDVGPRGLGHRLRTSQLQTRWTVSVLEEGREREGAESFPLLWQGC